MHCHTEAKPKDTVNYGIPRSARNDTEFYYLLRLCHSRLDRESGLIRIWIPAFAGMTSGV